jgi:hypothetical protein
MRLQTIQKTEKLYCLVLKFLDMALVTKLACINNLFHIHYYFKGDHTRAYKEGARQLSRLMRHLSSSSSSLSSSGPSAHYGLFGAYLNILLLLTEVPILATGAA